MKIRVLLLVFAMIFTMIVPAQANTSFSQDNLLQAEKYFGKYVVSVKTGDAWNEVGLLNFGKYQSKQTIDIGEYLQNDNIAVKLAQRGGGSAYLDAVFLGDKPAINVSDNSEKVLNKLSKEDLDITPVGEEGVTLEFASCDNSILTVVGRIEPVVISKEPLQFPAANNYKSKNEVKDFYNYTLDRNIGIVTVDGLLDEVKDLEPFVKEYRVPGSGHPAGDTYFWVMNDNDNLYVTIDVTPDNTFDGDKDYAKVYINTDEGIKEFRVSVPETIWGNTSFTYTDKVVYEHKVYEFVIPLSEINNNGSKEINLAFVIYGTVALTYIEFEKSEYNIDLNTNNTTQAEVFYFEYEGQDNRNNITNSKYIHYLSNDKNIATISETGLITGLTNGTTTIEAVYYEPQYYASLLEEGYELPYGALHAIATVTVTKTASKEPKLSFDKDIYSVVIGNAPYQTNVNYFDGITNHIVTNSENILYLEGDSNIADIVTEGAIKGISSGTTTISAIYTVGELTLTAEAYVNVTKPSSISSTPRTPIGEILVDKKVIQTLYKDDVNVKNNTYIFTANKEGNNAKLWLDSSFYKELAKEYPNRNINFVWDKGTYTLPLSCDEVLDEIDSSTKKINILLEKIGDKEVINAAKSSATNMGAEIISDLIDFCVFVEKSDKNVEINSLDFYAMRTINELNEIDEYISTAMKFVEDKEDLTFAPSVFGKDYASIKYRGNGIFTIIENPQTFNDIGSHWAKINIEKLASRNIAFGRQNKQFAPDDYVTRAEFAVMITRALGITEEEGTNDFKDVSNEWFAEDISTAFEADLINGRNDGKFYPNERIQRKDMAVMINNALKFADSGVEIANIDKVLSIFNDYSIIDAYAKESTAVCTNVGIIMGRDTKDFDPNENATRAEASAIIERMLRYLNFMN